jgi:hypothetical protein
MDHALRRATAQRRLDGAHLAKRRLDNLICRPRHKRGIGHPAAMQHAHRMPRVNKLPDNPNADK